MNAKARSVSKTPSSPRCQINSQPHLADETLIAKLGRHLPDATPDNVAAISEIIGRKARYSPQLACLLQRLNRHHGFDGVNCGFVRRECGAKRWIDFVGPDEFHEELKRRIRAGEFGEFTDQAS